jgi:hypothetical protein
VPSLRIFVSSSYSDLLDYRQAASDAIRGLDLSSDDMVLWSADGRNTTDYSVDRVRQSDVLVLLVAYRYGTVPDGMAHSITELEYRAAREAGVPVLAFFADPEVPWLPQHIDDSQERLREFKSHVEREVTRKFFRDPTDLAFKVTQALAQLLAVPPAPSSQRFAGTVRPVSTVSRLLHEPDVLVPIGTSEDGLPLLLEVVRSRDLSSPLEQLRRAVSGPNQSSTEELFDSFRAALVEHATRTWASEDLRQVRMRTGTDRRLYVTPFTLSGPFTSMLSGLVASADRHTRDLTGLASLGMGAGSIPLNLAAGADGTTDPGRLQSTGGQNRFLAVDPEDGAVYSVGRQDGEFVEWRPFLCESASPTFVGASVEVGPAPYGVTCPVAQVPDVLMEFARLSNKPDGRIEVATKLQVSRQAVLIVLGAVADALAALHAKGIVHGDVKPDNILVVPSGVELIDAFDVRVGSRSPGWTPQWSAPEQVRGEPVTPATDVFPLAIMAGRLLGGEIVGEVRKYRTPQALPTPHEVDLFHNPSLYVDPDRTLVAGPGVRAWRDLVERSLSFEPERRPPDAAAFAAELRALLDRHPVSGELSTRATGYLVASRLIDGTDAVARVVSAPPAGAVDVDFV